MGYKITGLSVENFQHLFGLPEDDLVKHRAKRYIAESRPGYPCRVTLEDAEPGEPLLLLPFRHLEVNTAYAAEGPIFVREQISRTGSSTDGIPASIAVRLISLRAYDVDGMMLDAEVAEGANLEPLITRFFSNSGVSFLHAHFARRGCFAARIDRT